MKMLGLTLYCWSFHWSSLIKLMPVKSISRVSLIESWTLLTMFEGGTVEGEPEPSHHRRRRQLVPLNFTARHHSQRISVKTGAQSLDSRLLYSRVSPGKMYKMEMDTEHPYTWPTTKVAFSPDGQSLYGSVDLYGVFDPFLKVSVRD